MNLLTAKSLPHFRERLVSKFLDSLSDRIVRRAFANRENLAAFLNRSGDRITELYPFTWQSNPLFFNHVNGRGSGAPYVVPAEAMFETTPTIAELTLAACPDAAGYQMLLEAVGVVFHTVPVDGTDAVTGDVEFVDDSDSDSVTNLYAAYDFETATARVYNLIERERQVLDPGDTVNLEATITTPDTAGAGAAFIVEASVLSKMAW